jgi:hypothetical protein
VDFDWSERGDDISLSDAIAVAECQRPAIRSGDDPVARRRITLDELTFAEFVEERFEKGSPLQHNRAARREIDREW